MRTAIIIVDMQNDFVEGGALAVSGGLALIPIINKIVAGMPKDSVIVTSQDWHPLETDHFGKWPVHCVAGSKGSALVDGLVLPERTIRVLKGTGTTDDGYSAFEGKTLASLVRDSTPLETILAELNVSSVQVCGLATDYCVRATALDAHERGFHTYLIENAVAGVGNLSTEESLSVMAKAGITFAKYF